MATYKLKQGVGEHYLGRGEACKPGEEIKLSEAAAAAHGDKFERVFTKEELAAQEEAAQAAAAPGGTDQPKAGAKAKG